MARDKELKVKAADEPTVEDLRTESPASEGRRPEGSAPPQSAPALKTANFVGPAWRGIEYMTSGEFQRRVYAYFGRQPSKSTMHRWLTRGRIAAVRVGKYWLIAESTWEEFLERCQHGEQF